MKTRAAVVAGEANFEIMRPRLKAAADMLRRKEVDLIIVVGTDREARFGSTFLSGAGAGRNVFTDGKSVDTADNALGALPLLRQNDVEEIALITSRFHMPRALFTFRTILPDDIRIVPDAIKDEAASGFHRYVSELFPVTLVIMLAKLIPAKRGELNNKADSALGNLVRAPKAKVYNEQDSEES